MQQHKQVNALEPFMQRFHDENQEGTASQQEPEETYHIYPVPGGMVLLSEEPEEDQIVDATLPQNTQPPSSLFTYASIFVCLIIPISSILFQIYLAFNPPEATVTIIPSVQAFTLKGTMQMGRMVHPITLSQSQIIPTTGKGHQDARAATGTLIFYNGQLTSITVPAGTMITGNDGIQIITDQDATIPAADLTANPPIIGNATVSAHAVAPGASGNIQALDVNKACCSSVVAKNVAGFSGGQDERNFQTVAKADVTNASTSLKTLIMQSTKGALQGQLKPGEELQTLPCNPIVASDHQIGDEATKVQVTVSQTCSAVAYNSEELKANTTQQLTSQAIKRLGAGYSLLGESQVKVIQITTGRPTPTLTFSSQGSFVYGLSARSQERMKTLIAGKTKQEALHILSSVPGIKNVSLQWDANTKLPKDPQQIKLLVIVNL
jgi:Baseplate J-like protein